MQRLTNSVTQQDVKFNQDYYRMSINISLEEQDLYNWKEAVKELFFPNWALKRRPIKYKTYSFYPQITFADKKPILLVKQT